MVAVKQSVMDVICTIWLNPPLNSEGRTATQGASIIGRESEVVRRQVIEARRKDSTNSERRVTAVPQYPMSQTGPSSSSGMLPPPVPSYSHGVQHPVYPQVQLPTSWQNQMSYTPLLPSYQSSGTTNYGYARGYSSDHSHYEASRQRWAPTSYQGATGETIGFIAQVLHEVPTKMKGPIVHNLSEGVTIPANAVPSMIIAEIIKEMKPRLQDATKGYPFNWNKLIVRDFKTWANIAREDPHRPYYYERCLVKSSSKSKDKARIFRKPKDPFIVAIIIDSDRWEHYLDFAAELDEEEKNHATSSQTPRTQSSRRPDTSSISISTRSQTGTTRLSGASWDTNIGNDSEVFDNVRGRDRETDKRPRTISLARPSTPPSKRRNVAEYVSPDGTQIHRALAMGGSTDIIRADNDNKLQRFTCDPQLAAPGFLTVEHSDTLGVGTFKSAHAGHLTLVHLFNQGLGKVPTDPVAVKRMYRTCTMKPDGTRRLKRKQSPILPATPKLKFGT
ncbi:hypothetical protein C8R43DRAFT_942991 [Mycena crocata]|nr:hypothetical protein C8R43DRAFT_942991 [Mycena crocata]